MFTILQRRFITLNSFQSFDTANICEKRCRIQQTCSEINSSSVYKVCTWVHGVMNHWGWHGGSCSQGLSISGLSLPLQFSLPTMVNNFLSSFFTHITLLSWTPDPQVDEHWKKYTTYIFFSNIKRQINSMTIHTNIWQKIARVYWNLKRWEHIQAYY